MKIKLIILFILLSVSQVWATDFYVDNSCGENGDGTTTTCGATGPFDSLANARTGLTGDQSNNRLLFKKGLTFSGPFSVTAYGTSGHNFTISSYGTGADPIISGGAYNVQFDYDGAYIRYVTVDGITFDSAVGGEGVWTGAVMIDGNADHITIQNCTISNASNGAEGGTQGINITNSNDNVINNNTIHTNDYSGIFVYQASGEDSTGTIISNNTVYGNMYLGIGIDGAYNAHFVDATTLVYGNTCYNNSTGIYLAFADSISVYKNTLYDNGADCQGTGDCLGEKYGFALQSGHNNLIYENKIYDNSTTGVGIYGDMEDPPSDVERSGPSSGNLFYRNILYGTAAGVWQRGLNFQTQEDECVGSDNVISNNLIYNNGTNFLSGDSDDTQTCTGNLFYNNSLYGGTYGIVFQYATSYAGWTFKNNIFSEGTTYLFDANLVTGGLVTESNLYFENGESGNVVRYDGTSYTLTTACNTFETTGCENTDPLFTTAGSVFTLQSGSPCIGDGTDLGNGLLYGLDPTSTWPNNVKPVNQDDYGDWEIGAFIYGPRRGMAFGGY